MGVMNDTYQVPKHTKLWQTPNFLAMCPVRCYIAEGHHQWVSTVLEAVPLILPEDEPCITKCSGQDCPHPIVKFRLGTSPFANTVGKLQRVSENSNELWKPTFRQMDPGLSFTWTDSVLGCTAFWSAGRYEYNRIRNNIAMNVIQVEVEKAIVAEGVWMMWREHSSYIGRSLNYTFVSSMLHWTPTQDFQKINALEQIGTSLLPSKFFPYPLTGSYSSTFIAWGVASYSGVSYLATSKCKQEQLERHLGSTQVWRWEPMNLTYLQYNSIRQQNSCRLSNTRCTGTKGLTDQSRALILCHSVWSFKLVNR